MFPDYLHLLFPPASSSASSRHRGLPFLLLYRRRLLLSCYINPRFPSYYTNVDIELEFAGPRDWNGAPIGRWNENGSRVVVRSMGV